MAQSTSPLLPDKSNPELPPLAFSTRRVVQAQAAAGETLSAQCTQSMKIGASVKSRRDVGIRPCTLCQMLEILSSVCAGVPGTQSLVSLPTANW